MKRNKILRVFSALALTTVICLGSLMTTFAAGAPIAGTETNPAEASIAKVLEVAAGTTVPTVQFTFNITAQSVDGIPATAVNMPAVNPQTLSYNPGDTPATASGVVKIPKETTDIFAGVSWPHAGEYTYTITEDNTAAAAGYTYSPGSYEITVYVANSSTGGLYVAAIGTTIKVADNSGQIINDKVDPTAGGNPAVTGDYSGLVFTNTYEETSGNVNPTAPNVALNISKTVAGAYGDHTKMFDYNLLLTKAPTTSGTPAYKAYVIDAATNAVVTSAANYSGTIQTDPTFGSYFTVTAGTAENYHLKHGQKLVIPQAVVGITYTVTEDAAASYTPSVAVITNGVATALSSGIGTALTVPGQIIGANGNSAAFTNTYKTVTPGGIGLNNLPFIMLLVLTVGTLVAFVAVKFRKRGYTNN